jgi:hypothetical protein
MFTNKMRVLRSFDEALLVATDCLHKSKVIKSTKLKNPPYQIEGPWEQTEQAAENTLRYIFEKLHHNCYLLCVGETSEIFKLESSTTAPSFKPALLKLNKTIKGTKRKTLAKTLKTKQWRVMQCVVKPYRESTSVEYPRFIEGLILQEGVYILNLTDAVILREDGTEPWPMVTGSKSLGKYNFASHLPILSCSGQKGYWDIPIPNYDDIRLVMGYDKIGVPMLDWKQKKAVAVFRGGPTGCGTTKETNMRLKLASLKSDNLDVGIVENKSGTLKFDPVDGLGTLQTDQKKVGFLDLITEQSRYKYIIHVDGNVVAYRLLKSMLTGSLILRVESEYTHWADHLLVEGKHYVSVNSDLSNLNEVIDWCSKNDSKCKKIAEQGMKFATKILTKEYLQSYFATLLASIHYKNGFIP